MKNKSQLSMFMVLGMVLFFSFAFLIYTVYNAKTSSVESIQGSSGIDSFGVKELVDQCLASSVKENAYNGFGFLDLSIPESVKECVDDFNSFPGIKISSGRPYSESNINDEDVAVSLNYPIIIEKGDSKEELKDFYYRFSTVSERFLPIDNGIISKDVTLYSPDMRSELFIAQGTQVRDIQGNPVPKIKIKMEDVSETVFVNMVDNVVYSIEPDVTFDPPAKIKIRYDPFNYLNILGMKYFNATKYAEEIIKDENKEFSVEEYPIESITEESSVIGKLVMPQELNTSDDDTIEEDETRYSIFRIEEILKSEQDTEDDIISADINMSGSYGVMPKDTTVTFDPLNYYTTDYTKVLEKESEGYRSELIGYTFNSGIPIYQYDIKSIDYPIFTTKDITSSISYDNSELEYKGVAGYLSEENVLGSVPLYSVISTNNLDMVTDTNEKTKSEKYLKTLLYEIISKAAPEVDQYEKGDEVFASIDQGKDFYEELDKATDGAIKSPNDMDKYMGQVNLDNVDVYYYMYNGILGYISVIETGGKPIYKISSDSMAMHFEFNNSMYITFEDITDEASNLITGMTILDMLDDGGSDPDPDKPSNNPSGSTSANSDQDISGDQSKSNTEKSSVLGKTGKAIGLGLATAGIAKVIGLTHPAAFAVVGLAYAAYKEFFSKEDNQQVSNPNNSKTSGGFFGAIADAVSGACKAIGRAIGLSDDESTTKASPDANGPEEGGGPGPGSGGLGSEGIGDTGDADGGKGDTCFPAGTQISLPDGKTKKIEDIKIGDYIISFDEVKKETKISKVEEIDQHLSEGIYTIVLENNRTLKVTGEHPLYIKKKNYEGWGALDTKKAKQYIRSIDTIINIEIGDSLMGINQTFLKIKYYYFEKTPIKTYNLKKVSEPKTYFAEGFLVHNKI